MSDQNLRKLVEAELDWDPCLDASRIGVAVDQSVVTLSGAAANYAEKMAAERAAQSIKGVLAIIATLLDPETLHRAPSTAPDSVPSNP